MLVYMAETPECVPVQEPHLSLYSLSQALVHLLWRQVCLTGVRQCHIPAPHITEHRHVLCIWQYLGEYTAQCSIDACEDLCATEEACWTTLCDEDAARIQLLQHYILVEVLQPYIATNRAPSLSGCPNLNLLHTQQVV